MKQQGIALFDFDGTIAKGDSIVPFVLYSVRKGFAPVSSIFTALFASVKYMLKLSDAARAKEESIAFLRGKPKHTVDSFAEQFYADVLRKRLFPDAVREIDACRQKGLMVIIVSASPDAYMQAVKKGLGVADVIATRCALDEKEQYIGKLSSENCKGFQKTLRVAEYLAARGLEADMRVSCSYGDSPSDVPMLLLTNKQTVVNGSRRLVKDTPQMKHVVWKSKN